MGQELDAVREKRIKTYMRLRKVVLANMLAEFENLIDLHNDDKCNTATEGSSKKMKL